MNDPARDRLASLYAEHAVAVLRYATRRTGSIEEAREVVQETFLVAWRRVGAIPQEDPLVWLYAVARNVLSNRGRSERRRGSLVRRVSAQPASIPDPAAGIETRVDLAGAMAGLKPDHREALALAYWEDLAPAKAARVMGRSQLAYNALLHRARAALQRRLAELEHPAKEVGP